MSKEFYKLFGEQPPSRRPNMTHNPVPRKKEAEAPIQFTKHNILNQEVWLSPVSKLVIVSKKPKKGFVKVKEFGYSNYKDAVAYYLDLLKLKQPKIEYVLTVQTEPLFHECVIENK